MGRTLSALVMLLAVAGCGIAGPEKQWMKIGQTYTTQDYRRDLKDCTKGAGLMSSGEVDEACMRDRGWVDVRVPEVKTPEPPTKSGSGIRGKY